MVRKEKEKEKEKKENVWRKTILFTVKLAVYDSVKMLKYTVKCEKNASH